MVIGPTTVLVVTGILIADFGEHESRNENTASEKENCENRKKIKYLI